MQTWEIVVLAVVAVLALLFLGGLAANARMRRERERDLGERIAAADHALAAARAADRGWDPALLEQAAREAAAARRPGVQLASLDLVAVVDRPGTEEDRARMRLAYADGAEEEIDLVRSGEGWSAG